MRSQFRIAIMLGSAAFAMAAMLTLPVWRDALVARARTAIDVSALEGRQAPGASDVEAGPAPFAAPAPAPAPREPRRPSGNPLWAVPLRSLSVTRDRPLFSPSRRPPAPAVTPALVVTAPPPAPPPAPPEHPSLMLAGTIVGEGEKIAIFFDPGSRTALRLRLGESNGGGWVLRSVGARDAVLEKDHQSFTLTLPAPGDNVPAPGAPPGSEEQL
jgi:general secretion pathway protein N